MSIVSWDGFGCLRRSNQVFDLVHKNLGGVPPPPPFFTYFSSCCCLVCFDYRERPSSHFWQPGPTFLDLPFSVAFFLTFKPQGWIAPTGPHASSDRLCLQSKRCHAGSEFKFDSPTKQVYINYINDGKMHATDTPSTHSLFV